MKFKHNIYGGGYKTNLHGLNFETKTFLGKLIEQNGFRLDQINKMNKSSFLYKIFHNHKFIGYYGSKNQIYLALKFLYPHKINNQYIAQVLSKKIFPDAFIINIWTKTLVIFEKKWQQRAGSVDEKIQTAPYKIAMFEKLLRNLPLKIMYHYILSRYFDSPKYRNIKEYYDANHQVEIFVENENLDQFNILTYLQS